MSEIGQSEEIYLQMLRELQRKRAALSPEIERVLAEMRSALVATMRGAIDKLGKLEIDRERPGLESRRNAETIMLSAIVRSMSGGEQ